MEMGGIFFNNLELYEKKYMKFSNKDLQFPMDLITCIEEIVNGEPLFLRSV